jgi:hypothetical protein
VITAAPVNQPVSGCEEGRQQHGQAGAFQDVGDRVAEPPATRTLPKTPPAPRITIATGGSTEPMTSAMRARSQPRRAPRK